MEDHKHREDYDRKSYIPIQVKCNDEEQFPGFRDEYIKDLLTTKEGDDFYWEEIKPLELFDELPGQWVSYIENNNKFRIGGTLVKHNEETDGGMGFIKEQERLSERNYVLYKGCKGNIISMQVKENNNCTCDWKKGPHSHPYAVTVFIKRKMQYYKKPTNVPESAIAFKGAYAIKLKDNQGIEQVVYYNRDRMKRERFIKTHKFKLAKKYGWNFI